MKLTNRTTPQAKNYQCDKCKKILSHMDMGDDELCYDCYIEESEKMKHKGDLQIYIRTD